VLVGDTPSIGGAFQPCLVNLNRISNDRIEGDFSDIILERATNEIGVKGIGAGNKVRLDVLDSGVEIGFWTSHEGELLLREIIVVSTEVYLMPKSR